MIHEPFANSFDKVGIKGKIFPSIEISSKAEFVLIETDYGHETTIRERESDFIYYIIEGSGIFEINDKDEACGKGDLVVIPAGSKFTYKGALKMLLVNTPLWHEEQEETL